MNENWCALFIAIVKNTTPEQAFQYYINGNRGVNKTLTNEDVLDMIKFRSEGMTYKKIAKCMELIGILYVAELNIMKKKKAG